jgi:hypothetical protein
LFFSEYTWELCIFVLKKKTVTILQQGPLTGRTHGIQRGLEDYTVQYHPKREKKARALCYPTVLAASHPIAARKHTALVIQIKFYPLSFWSHFNTLCFWTWGLHMKHI